MQGLFVASFVTAQGSGRAMMVALESEVFGGDAHFCFTGTRRETGKFVSLELKVRRHTPGRDSVFRHLDAYDLLLTGPLPGLRLAGTSPQVPGISSTVILERVPHGADKAGWRMLVEQMLE